MRALPGPKNKANSSATEGSEDTERIFVLRVQIQKTIRVYSRSAGSGQAV